MKSAYNAVSYLIQKGHKKIYHLAGPQNLIICRERYLGFEKAMRENGINDFRMVEGGMHEYDGYNSMTKLLMQDDIPDALFAVNDPVALGAFRKLKEANIKIPEQVSIIGFSNNPITEMVDPSLTTVEQPSMEMGRKAAQLLIDQIEGRQIALKSKLLIVDTKLIVRKSA